MTTKTTEIVYFFQPLPPEVSSNGIPMEKNAAETAVQAANKSRPPAISALWNAFAAQQSQARTQAEWIRAHMVAVSKFWNQTVSSTTIWLPTHLGLSDRAVSSLIWSGILPMDLTSNGPLSGVSLDFPWHPLYIAGLHASAIRCSHVDGFRFCSRTVVH